MTTGYQDFEFDLPGALLDHLVKIMDGMEAGPLTTAGLTGVPEAQGVYQLFLDGQLVYIGKTDAEAGLAHRLARHARKTLQRRGLDPSRVTFKAVRIFVFTAMDLETQLIRHYTGPNGTMWNGSGFGANDPGRNRDGSQPGRFDIQFPIDIDAPLALDVIGTHPAAHVLRELKAALPYTLRFQNRVGSRVPHDELAETMVTITPGTNTARGILEALTPQLPNGWQATALSALLILYKERKDNYPDAKILAFS